MSDTIPSPEQVMSLFKSRRSIRRYTPDAVPDGMVEQILEAGRCAPSASNRQPWSFVVVREEKIRHQVAENAAYYFVRWAHAKEAPLLIALCGNAKNRVYRQFLHEDVGLAGGQMMLQARALGLGTCWLGGLDRKAIGEILKLPPSWEVIGLLTVGFPAEDPPPTPRKPMAEIAHYDVFGNRTKEGEAIAGRIRSGPLGVLLRRLRFPFRV